MTGTALLRYDVRLTSPDRLQAALRPFGYELNEVRAAARASAGRWVTFEFLVCAVITMNLMSLAALRYLHGLGRLDSIPPYLPLIELGLMLPVLWFGFLPIARRALVGLRHGEMVMGPAHRRRGPGGVLLSVAGLAAGRGEIYFETAAGLVTITLLSRTIEARLRDRAFADVLALMRLEVTRVRVIDPGGVERFPPIGSIAVGDVVRFRPGETIPFDGEVVAGGGLVGEAVLTGEPRPRRRGPGDP